ncbi:MFS transporter [Streptomyces sp. MI02-2A]|uniref:MFS transporter n=1 Tax=Streptomyces sp. MI02-2A TaxID=3028688 RepID=UPI0029B30C30|nr:MFS transporter [Streptomyces sp. MI02-2A]MDX3258228.1 MFS transporter [Streptomyces sp. MI02-2A]
MIEPFHAKHASSNQRPAWLTLVLLSLAVFNVPVALTGAGVALPGVAEQFHPASQALQWVVVGYNVMFASLMLAFGTIADRVGRRRVFTLGITLFGVAAAVCTFAGSILVLDLARAVGGIGASATLTAGSTLVASRFEGAERIRAFGVFGTALGAGLAFGPLISGVMVTALGWRGVFAIPAIIGLLVAVFSPLLSESRNPNAQPLDWPGTLSFSTGLFLFIFALVEGPAFDWSSPVVLGSLAAFAVLMAVFYLVEKHHRSPMFDLHLLRHPRFMGISVTAMALAFSLLPLLVLLPTYFSAVEGYSALHSGGILVLFTAPMLVMPMFATRMSRRMSLRSRLAGAMVLVAGGMAWLTVIGPGVGVGVLAGPLLVAGFGYGITLAVLDGAAVSSVELDKAGMAAGMFNAFRLTADTAAAAVGGSLLISVTAARLAGKVSDPAAMTERLNGGVHTTVPVAADAITTALHIVIWLGAALALITVPVLVRTLRARATASHLVATSSVAAEPATEEVR